MLDSLVLHRTNELCRLGYVFYVVYRELSHVISDLRTAAEDQLLSMQHLLQVVQSG